jgi:hypothetical protein
MSEYLNLSVQPHVETKKIGRKEEIKKVVRKQEKKKKKKEQWF